MKKRYFERALIGEPRDADFTRAMLPKTRKRQLIFLLKTKWVKLYWTHLFTALWFLPLMLWNYFSINYTNSVFGKTAEESLAELPEYCLTVYGTAVPLWALAFLGLAGGLYVIRRMAWGENVRVGHDFMRGIRQSGLQLALVGAAFAALYGISTFAGYWMSFYQAIEGANIGLIIAQISSIIITLVLGGVTVYTVNVVNLYNVTYIQAWVAGFKLFFATLLTSSAVIGLSVAPMLVPIALGSFLSLVIGYFVILVGGLGLAMLLWVMLCLATCDKYINKKDYPKNYLRGLADGYVEPEEALMPETKAQPAQQEHIEDDFEIL